MSIKKKSIIFIVVDIVILVLFALFIPALLRNTLGYDVVEYENWGGELASSTVYRFGAGCAELTILLVKMIGFIAAQCRILKGSGRKQLVPAIAAHVVIGVLGFIYYFVFADGPSFIYMIQSMMNG